MERKTDLELFSELFNLISTKSTLVVDRDDVRSWKLNSMIAVDDKTTATMAIFVEPFLSVFLIDSRLTIEVDPKAENPSDFLRKLHAVEMGIDYWDDDGSQPSPAHLPHDFPSTLPVAPHSGHSAHKSGENALRTVPLHLPVR